MIWTVLFILFTAWLLGWIVTPILLGFIVLMLVAAVGEELIALAPRKSPYVPD